MLAPFISLIANVLQTTITCYIVPFSNTNILSPYLSFAFYVPTSYNTITGKVDKVEDLIDLLSEVRNDRSYPSTAGEQRPAQPGVQEGAPQPQEISQTGVSVLPPAGSVAGGRRPQQQAVRQPSEHAPVEPAAGNVGTGPQREPGELGQGNVPGETGGASANIPGGRPAAKAPELQADEREFVENPQKEKTLKYIISTLILIHRMKM